MKTLLKLLLLAMMAIITTSVFAQEWTKEQKEVWQVVENSWMKWKAGDPEGMVAALHPKFQGWDSESPLPMNKDAVVQWFRSMKEKSTQDGYWINPARIAVTENAAVVHYYYQYSVTYTTGDQKKQHKGQGKYTEFYVKEGGKWLCLGDVSVEDEEDDE
ncbi:MAG TPA: nuclear transport factor 2 family protein [Bacteroidales bacterium]|nr:nuclear transport factor 2 family protein [Bacteroidales bacterium]HNS45979.1 nuclear transport factor 2 family protein [Bacteroidales bacterium]